MDAIAILIELFSLNTVLSVNADGRLAYEGPSGVMTAERLAFVRNHRDELLAIVERIEERAAIMEIDGGLPQAEAERLARQETLGDSSERPAILCPYCRGCSLIEDPNGYRCESCNRLAWLYEGASIVRADVTQMNLHT